MYLGAASFNVFESQVDTEMPEWAVHIETQFLGYDCWAFIGRLNQADTCVGAFVLPFGPWTMDHEDVVNRLDQTPKGSIVNLPELLALFSEPVQVIGTFASVEGIIVAPHEDLELPPDSDKSVTFDLNGDLTIIAYAEDEDWVDGPVMILRSELMN